MSHDDVRSFLSAQLAAHADSLAEDDLAKISNFLHHDEYEMALEGLVLELARQGIKPTEADAALWLTHARRLGCDAEPAFDPDFGSKLIQWTGTSP